MVAEIARTGRPLVGSPSSCADDLEVFDGVERTAAGRFELELISRNNPPFVHNHTLAHSVIPIFVKPTGRYNGV